MEISEARRIHAVIGELLNVELNRDLVLVLVENYDRLEEAMLLADSKADEKHPIKKVDVVIKKLPAKLLPATIRGRFLVGMKKYMV
jgi:phospholipid N-methyltransferase